MDARLGIYIHIPFCASKCGYCDFYSKAGCSDQMPRYQQALITHIQEAAPRIAPAYIDTVYFGGGTPVRIPIKNSAPKHAPAPRRPRRLRR